MTKAIHVLVVVEMADDRPVDLCYEMLGLARRWVDAAGGAVHACVLGNGLDGVGDDLIAHGADRAHVVDAPVFAGYQADAWLPDLAAIVANVKPAAVMVGHTSQARTWRRAWPFAWVPPLPPDVTVFRSRTGSSM